MQLYNYTKAGSSNVIDPTFPDRVESDSCLNGASHVETRLATLIEEYLHTASTLNIIGKEIEALLEQKEAQAKQKEQRCKEIWLRAQKERMEMKSESTSTRSRMEKALHSNIYDSGATLESQKGKYPPANRNFPSKFRIPSNNSLALFHDNLAEDERVKSSNRAGTSNRLRARHVMDDERSTSIDTETTLSADESTGVMNEEDLRKLEEEEQIAIMEAIKEEEEEAWATADEPARVEGECIEAWAREVDWRWEMADELARIENQDIEAWVNGVKLGRTIQGTSQPMRRHEYPKFRGSYQPMIKYPTNIKNYGQSRGVEDSPVGHSGEIEELMAREEAQPAREVSQSEMERYEMEDRVAFNIKWKREAGFPFWGEDGDYDDYDGYDGYDDAEDSLWEENQEACIQWGEEMLREAMYI